MHREGPRELERKLRARHRPPLRRVEGRHGSDDHRHARVEPHQGGDAHPGGASGRDLGAIVDLLVAKRDDDAPGAVDEAVLPPVAREHHLSTDFQLELLRNLLLQLVQEGCAPRGRRVARPLHLIFRLKEDGGPGERSEVGLVLGVDVGVETVEPCGEDAVRRARLGVEMARGEEGRCRRGTPPLPHLVEKCDEALVPLLPDDFGERVRLNPALAPLCPLEREPSRV
mmetsp:Transcript_69843/g.160188  ORF Transcript_69843/g.160188 Transcript_69843/m.160188 type:complete len:227 (-) Transcript_69843:164-844(-)